MAAVLISALALSGCAEGDAEPVFAPVYDGIETGLLDGDLVNFRVAMRGARDEADVERYAECAAALDRIRAAQGILNQEHGRLTGQLRVTCATSFGQRFLGPFINEFAARHPGIDIDLFLTNRNVDLIEEGFDLGIRMGKLEDSSLLSRRLCDRTEYICASPDYFRRHPVPVSLEDLDRHNCLRGTNDFWNIYEAGERKRLPVSGRFRSNSGDVLLDSAIRGLGLVQLPDYYLGEALANGQLVTVLEEFRDPYSGVWLVYPNTRFRPRRLNTLIDFLTERFQAFLPSATSASWPH